MHGKYGVDTILRWSTMQKDMVIAIYLQTFFVRGDKIKTKDYHLTEIADFKAALVNPYNINT